MTWLTALQRIDRRLMSFPSRLRAVVILLTLFTMAVTVLPKLRGSEPGTDTIADTYEAKVILNDPSDMYTKQRLDQTPLEAATWSRAASAPYPPVALLGLTALYFVGHGAGIELRGMVTILALVFLALSLFYCLRTRWYVFPLLYLNFSYFGERFFLVQDGSYLIMLTLVMAALLTVRRSPSIAHLLMGLAITVKLSPLYYLRHLPRMPRGIAVAVVAIIVAGLVVPYFVWDNYLYIFRFNNELKGSVATGVWAVFAATLFGLAVWYAEARLAFDLEDLIGWSLVPVAIFLAFKMNVARHLLIVLLIPDKRVVRSLAAAIGLAVPELFPGLVLQNSALPIAAGVLAAGLAMAVAAEHRAVRSGAASV